VRVVIALGGNAMTGDDGRAGPEDQRIAVDAAMQDVADLISSGIEVVLTHGNGPQVGNLLVKNELAAAVVPPVPLDWCGAQTQATIGMLVLNALDAALAERHVGRRPAVVVTRTLVDPDDPGFANPSKPIGRFLPESEARSLAEHGQTWQDRGSRGWRRMVASPEPRDVVDAPAIAALLEAGFVAVGAGGGGIPVVRGPDGTLRGVEAVVDKDLAAALLARLLDADALVIATDVDHAMVGFGTADERPIGATTVSELRALGAAGEFASGSMGPKVEAAIRFVEQGGGLSAITSLRRIGEAVRGHAGTLVRAG
jgi:carbamate kinase